MSLGKSSESPHWITISSAAKLADVSPNTVRRWALRGLVPSATAPSGRLRVDRNALTKESLRQRRVDDILASV